MSYLTRKAKLHRSGLSGDTVLAPLSTSTTFLYLKRHPNCMHMMHSHITSTTNCIHVQQDLDLLVQWANRWN